MEYGVAPNLLRACVWAMIGLGVVAATLVALEVWMPGAAGPAAPSLAERLAVLGCIVVALALPFRWRLRVDEHGVARRRVLGWTHWSWAELESGCVLKQGGLRLVHPHRPWWNRSLDLGSLGGARAREVMERINTRYRLPPAPPMPAELQLELGRGTRVTADHRGLRVTTRKRDERFAWSEVPAIWIRRHDPVRRDFASVTIALPSGGKQIELIPRSKRGEWRGPEPGVVSEYLRRHAPPGCVRERLQGAPPESEDRTTLEQWLSEVRRAHREWRIANGVMATVLVLSLVWMAVDVSLAGAASTLALMLLGVGPIAWFRDREQREQVARLAAALNASDCATGHDSTTSSGP